MQKGVFRAIETPQGAWTIIMPTNQMQEWGVGVSKATALEEMYLIYQAFRNYLADSEPWGSSGWRIWWLPTTPSVNGSLLGGCSWSPCWKSCWTGPGDVHGIIISQSSCPRNDSLQ